MNIIEGNLKLNGSEKVAIIASRFNHLITDRLIEGAKDAFVRNGGNESKLDLILVPGAFELPFALKRALKKDIYDGIVCVGAVIRGATPHFDYVAAEATKGIANTTLAFETPVTFGLLTTDTIEQAIERAGTKVGNKGFEAMSGLIEMINLYKEL
ncbi:MAG: 6,7-dimethyl-8-ribityllumazine synthase [Epsilonproteobacteria bacterium]|nr:6,7-dimethyl-8-ribityllumazine synthase [Campylobacterota bacterium]